MSDGGWPARILIAPFLALLAGILAGNAYAAENAAREPRIGVYVEVDTPPLTIHEHPEPLLPRGGSGGGRLDGLAVLELFMQAEYDMTLVSYSSGGSMFWVTGISVTLAYRNPEVYIAGRHPKGSCEYRSVRDHEDEHVGADREVVKTFAERMESALRLGDWPTYSNPRPVSSMEEGKAETTAKLEALIRPIFEELKARRREVRQALDSEENYQRTQQQCTPRSGPA